MDAPTRNGIERLHAAYPEVRVLHVDAHVKSGKA
jgi:hypothetical protein